MVNIDYTQAQNEALKKQNLDLQKDYAKLQKEYDILDGIIDKNNAKIGQLEKENKELREKLQTNYNDDIKKSDEIFLLACKKNAYLQALQEIKEIAERAMAKQQEYKKDFEQILEKISKVEFTE